MSYSSWVGVGKIDDDSLEAGIIKISSGLKYFVNAFLIWEYNSQMFVKQCESPSLFGIIVDTIGAKIITLALM